MSDADPHATILSVDGISAYDSISRVATLRGLQQMEGGDALLPFVSQFYGSPMRSHRAKEGEQGDALMPALFSLGQHSALEAIQARLRLDERLMAFLDDIYAKSNPNRSVTVFTAVQEELQRWAFKFMTAKPSCGTDLEWCQLEPEALTEAARISDPDAIVWRGDVSLPPQERGVKVLGTPMGSPMGLDRHWQQSRRSTTV